MTRVFVNPSFASLKAEKAHAISENSGKTARMSSLVTQVLLPIFSCACTILTLNFENEISLKAAREH